MHTRTHALCCALQVRLAHAESIEGVIARQNLSSKEELVGMGTDLRNCVVKDQVRRGVHARAGRVCGALLCGAVA